MRGNPKGAVIWLTGLSGSGKTTIAAALREHLLSRGIGATALDGDELRKSISADLGFDRAARVEHASRVAHLAKDVMEEGRVAIVALISPYRESRERARSEITRFIEVYVHCPLKVLIARDPKGLYAKALRGEIDKFTGISDPYEIPLAPEVTIDTSTTPPHDATAVIVRELTSSGYLEEPHQ